MVTNSSQIFLLIGILPQPRSSSRKKGARTSLFGRFIHSFPLKFAMLGLKFQFKWFRWQEAETLFQSTSRNMQWHSQSKIYST